MLNFYEALIYGVLITYELGNPLLDAKKITNARLQLLRRETQGPIRSSFLSNYCLSVFKLSISVILICGRYSKYCLRPQRRKMMIIDRFAEI